MSPFHLHATAAAWSLQAARGRLAQLADEEAAQIAAEALEAPSVLRSTVYGGRHGSGGHSDPTAGRIAVADRPERRNRWAEMAERLDGKLRWLADQMPPPPTNPTWDPIERILARLPWTQPGTASVFTRHLADEDRWVREACGLGPARHPLVGVPCPNCGHRELYVQDAGPTDTWTVVCATGCRCKGAAPNPAKSCPCRMPGAVEGVAHIWPRASVLAGAVAGAAPTNRED